MERLAKKLSSKEKELYQRTDEVLHYIWDPIGVAEIPYARDEYWIYLPKVFSMLVRNEPTDVIVNFLLTVEKDSMELIPPDKTKAEHVVEILEEYKEKIFGESS